MSTPSDPPKPIKKQKGLTTEETEKLLVNFYDNFPELMKALEEKNDGTQD